ncbi:hypothetical protein ACFQH6_18030 [Halobacteriaceae archaeon GCM10025711]
MAYISSPTLQLQKITTSSGTHGKVDYSYRLSFSGDDVEHNSWYRVHVTLWERDGSGKDFLSTRYNGSRYVVKRMGGDDDYISYVDGRWVRPNGSYSAYISGSRTYTPSQLHEESGNEEYYLHVAAHPWSGGDAEEYSNEYSLNF